MKKYSPEQLRKMKEKSRERAREKMQKSMAMLEEGVVALADLDRWQQYLKFQSKFHRYSFHEHSPDSVSKARGNLCGGVYKMERVGKACQGR